MRALTFTTDDWKAYNAAAEWCAKRGSKGAIGDQLPNLMGSGTVALINADPEAFADHVRMTAYALAMEKTKRSTVDEADSNGCQCLCQQTSFWVIERFENGKSLGYWNGDSSRDFVTDIDLAIQFRRRADAWRIKRGWHWMDTEVTEHSYLSHESDPHS